MYRPTVDETFAALLSMLPEGEAWQSGDIVIGHDKTVMRRVFYALAIQFNRVELAIADLFAELFVSTASTDLDLWREEYILPDSDCDPWGDDVVLKATSVGGGTSLAYYAGIVARLGYVADLRWLKGSDPAFPGVVSTLHLTIDAAASAAVLSEIDVTTWELSDAALGTPDVSGLICALEQVVHAHCAVTYEFA